MPVGLLLTWSVQTAHQVVRETIQPAPTLPSNDGSMLAHRLRRWATIDPSLVQRLVFAGQTISLIHVCESNDTI